MKRLFILFALSAACISAVQIDAEDFADEGLHSANASSVMHNGILIDKRFLKAMISQESTSNVLMTLLASANPKTVRRILNLLYSLIAQNQKQIRRLNGNIKNAYRKQKKKQKTYANLYALRGELDRRLNVRIKTRKDLIKETTGAQSDLNLLDQKILALRRKVSVANLALTDSKKAIIYHIPTLKNQNKMIRLIMRLTNKLLYTGKPRERRSFLAKSRLVSQIGSKSKVHMKAKKNAKKVIPGMETKKNNTLTEADMDKLPIVA